MVYSGNSKTTWETFQNLEERLRAVHADKYSYNNSVFVNARTPMLITCPVHGDFLQRPRDHKRGQGCEKCSTIRRTDIRTRDITETVKKIHTVDKFEYPELNNQVALKSHDYILTVCKKCGNTRQHRVCDILSGKAGCRICFKSLNGWSADRYKDKETILYFVRINNLYKIGLTMKSVASRYYKELKAGYDIEVIFTIKYSNGAEAFKEEQRILEENTKFRYKGDKMLIDGGDSELFITNIFSNEGGVPSIQ